MKTAKFISHIIQTTSPKPTGKQAFARTDQNSSGSDFRPESRQSPKRRWPLSLFDIPEPSSFPENAEEIEVSSHSRKKKGRRPLPDHLRRIEVIHDLPEEEKKCACGNEKTRMGEDVSEQLDYIPAKVQVIRHIRIKYACKNCEGVGDDGPTVSIARMPEQIIPKSIATP